MNIRISEKSFYYFSKLMHICSLCNKFEACSSCFGANLQCIWVLLLQIRSVSKLICCKFAVYLSWFAANLQCIWAALLQIFWASSLQIRNIWELSGCKSAGVSAALYCKLEFLYNNIHFYEYSASFEEASCIISRNIPHQ